MATATIHQPLALRRQSRNPQTGKAREIAIGGEQFIDAVLPANGGDLGVEDEISSNAARDACLIESRGVSGCRIEQSNRRTFHELAEKIQRLRERARWIENPQMGDDADEFCQAEDRQRPRSIGFSDGGDFFEGRVMMRGFSPVSVDENIGIDSDHPSRSMRS